MALKKRLLFSLLVMLGSCSVVLSGDDSCGALNITREAGRCIWFGECLEDGTYVTGGELNCYDNNMARNITSMGPEFEAMVNMTCPQFLKGGYVCCDYSQLDALTTQIKYPRQLFRRCPACLKNFIEHFCLTTCDPDQSLYMEPTSCKTKAGTENLTVATVDIYLSSEYAGDMYDSCSNVQYPQASSRVVDIMCGGSDVCNASLWLGFLGDPKQNHNSPFPMTYIIGSKNLPKGVKPKEYTFEPCNTNISSLRCSCADCGTPDICPAPPQAPRRLFSTSTVFYSVLGVGLCLSVAIFIAAMMCGLFLYVRTTRVGGLSRGGYGAMKSEDSPTSSVGSINAEDVPSFAPDPLCSNMLGDRFGAQLEKVVQLGRNGCMPFYVFGAHLENWIKTVFYKWGLFVAQFWPLVMAVGLGLIVLLMGLTAALHFTNTVPFVITTDPVQLWSAPDSRARQEKDYFDKNFNPFYRNELMIFTAKEQIYTTFQPLNVYGVEGWTFGPVLTNEVLLEVYRIQDYLINMVAEGTLDNGTDVNVTLQDICFKPLAPDNDDCTIMSVLNYFQNNFTRLTNTSNFGLINNSYHIHYCTRDPTAPEGTYFDIPCLGAFGGPVDPNVILGGFNSLPNGSPNYQNATALIVSFTVNNHVNDEENQYAKIWEKAFLDYIQNDSLTQTNHTHVTHLAERSIEDELKRESKTDVFTVLLSYLLMFAYITLFLGHIRKPLTILIDMKISVGFLGVLLVLFAVIGSICFLNLVRVTVTLIIIEVVPFLVLAVGVDNLFIIVHSYERQVKRFAEANHGNMNGVTSKELIGRAIAEVAPSLLLTSLSETTAFMLGAISTMPAVRTFSMYAGVAVFFNFLLQISVFLAALSIDAKRQLANRFDILCCIKIKGMFDPRKGVDIMQSVMNVFAKFILNPVVRPFVLLFFCVTSTVSLAFMFKLEIGLDQTVALPKDSYVNAYFADMYKYLHTGSPVYFVIKGGFNYSDPGYQKMFCSAAGCDKNSIGSEIFGYSRDPELTGIAEPAMLWLDTYFAWIVPSSQCCGKTANGSFCLYPKNDANATCRPCVESLNTTYDWPYPDDFETYLKFFLSDNPGRRCPSGGHAAFAGGVKLNPDNRTVKTSYIMTYHSIMSTSSNFINGLKWARKLGATLTNYTGVEIFPYSVFYVYYEQYLTTIQDMALNIGVSIGAVFLVTFLMMGLNLWAALIVMLIVVMIIVHMLGCMALTGINANAVSLVNLVMTVGISVEFCSHIVRWFCSCSERTREERARSALANMGASVVSGITLTKLIGVFVLFFAKSQIFEVYYFRMYMFMLLWGALHGLVFLPVLLSYFGPPYVHVDVVPPYEDFMAPKKAPPAVQKNRGGSDPSAVPSAPEISSTVQYPSLPNLGTYMPPPLNEPAVYSSGQQQYPPPTYPRPLHSEPTEHTRLLDS